MLLRPGDVLEGSLDTYLICATINRGSYGCAHRARTSGGEWRVIKQFEPSEELTSEEEAYQRRCFEREAEILTRYRLPLIVRGDELIRRDAEALLVMEHVQGQALRAIFDQRLLHGDRPFDPPTVVGLGRQLCDAIESLHGTPEAIIYRDLKPANIMWDAVAQQLKLIDFGTARANATESQATQGLGTEGYAPPELYGSRELTPATDVYTIGAVLYELLTGQTPPSRRTPDHFHGYDESIPLPLRQAILTALQQEPAARYQSAAELKAVLSAEPANTPPLRVPAANHHPLMACYCPVCGREPETEQSLFCGYDGAMVHVAILQLAPRHRPATTVYLDRREVDLGRNDPEQGHFPALDLTAADPARHVSRRHAKIRRDGLSYRLAVAATTNPTWVDGRRVEPGSDIPIAPGSRLEFGDLAATLLLKPALDPIRADGGPA